MKTILTVLALALLVPAITSARTMKNYKAQVRTACLGDTALANDPIKDSVLMDWINDGRFLVSALTGGMQKDTTIRTVVGTVEYAMPSTYAGKGRVVTSLAKNTMPGLTGGIIGSQTIDPEKAGGAAITEGPTKEHWIWGMDSAATLFISPPPIGKYDIRVLYIGNPTTLDEDTDTCDLPPTLQITALEYAKSKAYEKLGMSAEASSSNSLFNAYWQALRATLFSGPQSNAVGP